MAELNQQQVVDYIKGISVLELSQLVKALEQELGVSAAAAVPVAMAGAPAAGGGAAAPAEEKTEFNVTLTEVGAKLFDDLACSNCHKPDGSGRCPSLVGVYGSTVKLSGGGTVKADDAYIRESILNPAAKVVSGYEPLMPTFQGQVTEENVVQLIAYIKSLAEKPAAQPNQPGSPVTAGSTASNR